MTSWLEKMGNELRPGMIVRWLVEPDGTIPRAGSKVSAVGEIPSSNKSKAASYSFLLRVVEKHHNNWSRWEVLEIYVRDPIELKHPEATRELFFYYDFDPYEVLT